VIAINHSAAPATMSVTGHDLLTDSGVGPTVTVQGGETLVVRVASP
jgi:hypothetical protein